MATIWQSDPEIDYEGSRLVSVSDQKADIKQVYIEEPKHIFDDPEKKKETLSFDAVADVEEIGELFRSQYTSDTPDTSDSLGKWIDSGEGEDVTELLSSAFGIDLNKAKRRARAGQRAFERFWLKNVRQQNRRRRRNQDAFNTQSQLDEALDAENSRVGPLGTQRVSGQRLGSTPEVDASEVRLGNG